ncbi:MAG: type II 3-dehydroquinate dehydratase [Planctomycetales bacterium 4484_113]|nr:MAG: type II 3-dehydroquinate dehydratase [Planctomycetales bacterium 4484_113]
MRILIINGPNLELTGRREPAHYGTASLSEIEAELRKWAEKWSEESGKPLELEFFQSNSEGELVNKLNSAHKGFDGVVINPGGLTHYSLALRDSIAALPIPKVEVHMSNLFAREPFRRRSVTAPVTNGVICGFGKESYLLALTWLVEKGHDTGR